MGKDLSGLELSHNRNCGSTSAPGFWKLQHKNHRQKLAENSTPSTHFSTIVCRRGIQLAARWQFCRKIQRPFRICAFEMRSSAFGP